MKLEEAKTELYSLAKRTDIPEDVRKTISTTLDKVRTPLHTDVWIYRAVIIILGVTVCATVFGGIYIAIIAKGDATIKIPDAIVAIGSAAVGALAGLLAPSPVAE